MNELARLVVVLGPTASGKSSLGVALARQLGGAVLACDSTQVYRHFDIGTAKVPRAEQHDVPHHLADLVEPGEVFTAGEFRLRALDVLADVRRSGRLPVITAGTGLYLRALLEGLSDAPARSDVLRERLRSSAKKRGPRHLHQLLARLDPQAAARIAPRDTQKVIRAIEIRLLAGKSVAEIHSAGRSRLEGYNIRKIGLLPTRPALYTRIDARVLAMLRAGWLGEVRNLVAAGVPLDAKPFQFIGYSELRKHLEGSMTIEQASRQIQAATRRFAKRQITWFRKEPGVHWLSGFGDDPAIVAAALSIAQGAC